MTCGDFQQFRIADLLTVEFSGEELVKGSFDLSSALDVGPFKGLTVTLTVFMSAFGANVTGVRFNGRTAAVNNESYYGNTSESIVLATEVDEGPQTWVGVFEEMSRFWLPGWSLQGTSISGTTKLLVTIDVVARG